MRLRTSAIFGSTEGMNCWPPKPGLTDISSTRSSLSSVWSRQDSGVAGLSTSPALQPFSLISAIVRSTCSDASGWKLMMLGAGLGEIGHQSGRPASPSGARRSAASRAGAAPRTPAARWSGSARSGCPSRRSGSGRRRRARPRVTSSPSRAKSAERMLGAMRKAMVGVEFTMRPWPGKAIRRRGERARRSTSPTSPTRRPAATSSPTPSPSATPAASPRS